MLRKQMLRQPIFFHAAALGLILTLLGGAAAVAVQQMLRRGANQPQSEMAEFYPSEINSGNDPRNVIPPGHVEFQRNLERFVIFYYIQGNQKSLLAIWTSPSRLPPGVLADVRCDATETVTWQPRPGVCIAAAQNM